MDSSSKYGIFDNYKDFNSHRNYLCTMIAKTFELSARRGYSATQLMQSILNTEYGEHIFCKDESMFIGETYILECLTNGIKPSMIGNEENSDFMYWAGYLYKYWSIETGETIQQIHEQAPLEQLRRCYVGYHVMDWQLIIEDMKELYEQKSGLSRLSSEKEKSQGD